MTQHTIKAVYPLEVEITYEWKRRGPNGDAEIDLVSVRAADLSDPILRDWAAEWLDGEGWDSANDAALDAHFAEHGPDR